MDTNGTVLSVPHSGSNWAKATFSFPIVHTYDTLENIKKHLEKVETIVSPLRHPASIWESWARRRGTGFAVPMEHWWVSWRNLATLDKLYNIFYVPLDTEYGPTAVASISKHCGKEITPDFDSRPGRIEDRALIGQEEAPNMDLSEIYEMDIIKRYYGNLGL